MINQTYIDDKKVKDILTYISGMRHSEQIKMMFLSIKTVRAELPLSYKSEGLLPREVFKIQTG